MSSADFVNELIHSIVQDMERHQRLRSDINHKNTAEWINVSKEVQEHRRQEIEKLLHSSMEVFKFEARVVRVDGPANVFGDIHGNLADLMIFEKHF